VSLIASEGIFLKGLTDLNFLWTQWGSMKRKRLCLVGVLVLVLSLCVASSAAAQGYGPSPTRDGFFLRLSAGFGAAQSGLEQDGTKITIGNPGSADLNFAIGGIVSDNLAVHGTLAGWRISDPEVELSSGSTSQSDTLDGSVQLTLIGAGITAYFGDNFYFSPSIGAAMLAVESNGETEESDMGYGLDLTFGKEWWVSPSWSIGAAAALGVHKIPDEDLEPDYEGGNLAVRFSATFN
jgi:hypothetical protein